MYSKLSNKEIDILYNMRHIGAYKPLSDSSGWLVCAKCGVLPRTWRFDNGCHATCLCFRMYENHPARSECVNSYAKRMNCNFTDYQHNSLRDAWNKYVETGEPQNILPEGQW